MQISVKLQDMFSYSIYYIFIVFILVFALTIYFIVTRKKKTRDNEEEIIVKKAETKDLNAIKNKYIKKIENLEEKLNNKKISIRGAYQSLSSIIRYFVYEVTNIKVQNYTLREIERLKMPELSELIKEYYAPEFAKHSLGNIKESISKTRKVIEKWN